MQDAAYESLLKSRRQELHAKIARVIEKRFPNIRNTEPEVLAHHLTAAGLTESAVPLWQSARRAGIKADGPYRGHLHLDRGLELVSAFPHSSGQDANELGLRSRLGTAWLALNGWPAPRSLDQPAPRACPGEVAGPSRWRRRPGSSGDDRWTS